MYNNTLSHQNSFRSSVTSRDSSKGKYQKFKSILREGTQAEESSREWNNLVDGGEKNKLFNRQINHTKSHSSIRSSQTPSKLPNTPMKNIFTSYSRKGNAESSFKYLLSEIEIIKHQFNLFVEKMEQEIKRTIEIVLQNLEAGITVFLRKQFLNSQSDISFSPKRSNNKSKESKLSSMRNKREEQVLEGLMSQKEIVRTESIQTFTELDSPRKQSFNYSLQAEEKSERNSFFSNTIRVREELKNEAKKPLQKVSLQETYTSSFGIDALKLDEQKNRINRMSVKGQEEKREGKKSVEKLQSQLRSLKNLLNG